MVMHFLRFFKLLISEVVKNFWQNWLRTHPEKLSVNATLF